jgi:SAM-dependent methyltransferase
MSEAPFLARLRYGATVARRGVGVLAGRARGSMPSLRAGSPHDPRGSVPFNTMFGQTLLPALETEKRELASTDLYLFDVMTSPRLRGQIVFEYGTLLRAIDGWTGRTVLDVGTGRSTLPQWMSRQGARVVTLELSTPVERHTPGFHARVDDLVRRRGGDVQPVTGSMRSLPFADRCLDLVTSLSVVEHLDTDLPARTYVPYDEQQRRLATVLDEMIRVTRRGGHVYLTSECCDFRRATGDRWREAYYYDEGPPLSGAWPVGDVQRLFYEYATTRGLTLVGGSTFDAEAIAHERHWTWRGPYFSGFSLLARKG